MKTKTNKTTTTTTTRRPAKEAYEDHAARGRVLMGWLDQAMKNHRSRARACPDVIWPWVGDLQQLNATLVEGLAQFTGEEQDELFRKLDEVAPAY